MVRHINAGAFACICVRVRVGVSGCGCRVRRVGVSGCGCRVRVVRAVGALIKLECARLYVCVSPPPSLPFPRSRMLWVLSPTRTPLQTKAAVARWNKPWKSPAGVFGLPPAAVFENRDSAGARTIGTQCVGALPGSKLVSAWLLDAKQHVANTCQRETSRRCGGRHLPWQEQLHN